MPKRTLIFVGVMMLVATLGALIQELTGEESGASIAAAIIGPLVVVSLGWWLVRDWVQAPSSDPAVELAHRRQLAHEDIRQREADRRNQLLDDHWESMQQETPNASDPKPEM